MWLLCTRDTSCEISLPFFPFVIPTHLWDTGYGFLFSPFSLSWCLSVLLQLLAASQPEQVPCQPSPLMAAHFIKGWLLWWMIRLRRMKEQGIFFLFLRKKSLLLASERHIVNRVSPNLASFYQEGAHRGWKLFLWCSMCETGCGRWKH